MRILHLSDTHGLHHRINNMPEADVIIHSGDISNSGTEEEVLDFMNWMIELPYQHKIFVTGNHDLCLWDAEVIEDLPNNLHFLQDKSITINGVKFYGLAYNHPEDLIPNDIDIVITHEPPVMILDESAGIHWGNAPLRNRIFEVKPSYHLFGHAHDDYGFIKQDGIVFSNAALLNDRLQITRKPRLFNLEP
ncbi:MAG: metallophosphatase domain-containing protein [Bacteroidaceae bacterium]|nr:metallophosphatase domain-containing protein [Bacteroidaceae bacterium]